jgi:SAM-dependent methyltransferase
MTSTLYDFPDLYDLVMKPNPAAQAFYLDVARTYGPSVLVLCCGTGRISNALARSGLTVEGLDLSSAMLARCRADAAATGATITLHQGDMRAFDLDGRRFGLVIIPHNSLLHLLDVAELEACFASIAKHLTPTGALAFDIFTPSSAILARPPGGRRRIGVFAHPELGEITLDETSAYDAAAQVNRAMWFWSTPQQPDMLTIPLPLRQIFPQELPLLLEHGGFRLIERYGNFDRAPFGPKSPHQVCLCEVDRS